MSKLKTSKLGFSLAAGVFALGLTAGAHADGSNWDGIGMYITEEAVEPWDISYFFDGENLPPGEGSVEAGEDPYYAECAMCHGDFGEGARGYPKMVGDPMPQYVNNLQTGADGVGTRGVNNLWAHAPTLMDMIHRHMPFYAPGTLSNDDAYAITCYVLNLAEIVDWDFVCNADTLPEIHMPSADYFVSETRPDVANERCMENCFLEEPEVVYSAVGDVTTATE